MKTRHHKKALMAAGLLAIAALMTGCGAQTTPDATPTPNAAQKVTTQPTAEQASAAPTGSPEVLPEATTDAEQQTELALRVEEKEVMPGAVLEKDMLLLPLEETAKALGYSVTSDALEEETQVKKTVQLKKDDSQITVAWTVSDNTAKQITWQKDRLLIPVDTLLTTIGDSVYVPAEFFEVAMDVAVDRTVDGVTVSPPKSAQTPANDAQQQDKQVAD